MVAQVALALGFFAFAAYAGFAIERDPATGRIALAASAAAMLGVIALLLSFASATQDIALRRLLGRGAPRRRSSGPASGRG